MFLALKKYAYQSIKKDYVYMSLKKDVSIKKDVFLPMTDDVYLSIKKNLFLSLKDVFLSINYVHLSMRKDRYLSMKKDGFLAKKMTISKRSIQSSPGQRSAQSATRTIPFFLLTAFSPPSS
jgi:hypothetical protein